MIRPGALGTDPGVEGDGTGGARNGWRIAWCHQGDAGGSKRAAFEMVRELSRRGHVIDEFVLRGSAINLNHFALEPYVRASSSTVIEGPRWVLRPHALDTWAGIGRDLWKTLQIRRSIAKLAGFLNAGEYDFVHIDQYPGCITISLAPQLRLPSIVYCHEASKSRYSLPASEKSECRESFLRRSYVWLCEIPSRPMRYLRNRNDIAETRQATLVLTNSCYSKEIFFQRYGCMASVCHYGVDVETFRPLSLPAESFVLSVGRLVRSKQHHTVVEALGAIEESHRPRLIVTTPENADRLEDPAYGAWLDRLANEKGVDLQIRMNPRQSELVELYNRAMVMVFVPVMEPFGLVALESMACGTPVIGVREAGVRESVVDGVNGILVGRDPEEIAAAIDCLQERDDVRTRMAEKGVEYVRTEWTWQRTVDCYEAEVRRVLDAD